MMPIMLLAHSKSILGVNMLKIGDAKPEIIQHCITELVALWKEGKIKPIATEVFKKDQLAEAHQKLESRQITGKAIVEIV